MPPSPLPLVPTSTYRLQFGPAPTGGPGVDLAQARRLVAYLRDLGVGALYASPLLKARPGSRHGYDVVDHGALRDELGPPEALEALSADLRAAGLGLLLDFVANHMGIGRWNPWWQDVLEHGPSSPFATFFDIDWAPLKPALQGKVLVPVLGDHYGRVLEAGQLRLQHEAGAFAIAYFDELFPLAPETAAVLLEATLPHVAHEVGEDHDAALELQSIAAGLRRLPARIETRRARVAERRRETAILRRRLATLLEAEPAVATGLAAAVTLWNGTPGQPPSFDALDALLAEQGWRLSYWRVAGEQINYRRFFESNDLAALRMEAPGVFAAAHRLVLDLAARGVVTGLRIDHPDGLWDPRGYLQTLQAATGGGLHLVVEKILARGESLPDDWPVHGTVGYEFGANCTALLVDPAGEAPLTATYEAFTGERLDFDRLVHEKKRLLLRTALASELQVLAHALARIADRDRRSRDFTLGSLTECLREIIAAFPVYRTYVDEAALAPSDQDRLAIARAVRLARQRNPVAEDTVFAFLRDLLQLVDPPGLPDEDRRLRRQFVLKLQQLTGPVMAKGVEDTAFYVYNRLAALNEVGGEPERFGLSLQAFHRQNQERQRRWPHALLTTSTHDTKRSEDVRARIGVLSELPDAWSAALHDLAALAEPLRVEVDGRMAPDRNEQVLLLQTLLGSWPVGLDAVAGPALAAYTDRIAAWVEKAVKEAKVNTSWLDADPSYAQAVQDHVRALLAPDGTFLRRLLPLVDTVTWHGFWASLTQVTLKCTSPGVPDVYQGNELWDFSLVDPDNRRPVDWDLRQRLLGELQGRLRQDGGPTVQYASELLATPEDGRIKLYVTWRLLTLRRERPELLSGHADYEPVSATGRFADHVVAWLRRAGESTLLVVAPRWTGRLLEGKRERPVGAAWADTRLALPDLGRGQVAWLDRFTGRTLALQGGEVTLAEMLREFPVAVWVA